MSHHWDEFTKSLAEESLPRRESLRRLALVVAGAALSPFGLSAAWARGPQDPCKAFCKCRNKSQQNQCLAACRACNGDVSRVCGSCGSGYICCGDGGTCCGNYCVDLDSDIFNCGACGNACPPPGPNETMACINGRCEYDCVDGTVSCGNACTYLDWDPYNCGACGNVCPDSAPYCTQGTCSPCPPGLAQCGNLCVNLTSDPGNCGACGSICGGATPYCLGGQCGDCAEGLVACNGICTDTSSDPYNCGNCGVQCPSDSICIGGICVFGGGGW